MYEQATIAELLKGAISAINGLAQEYGLGPEVPVSEYEVRWWEPREVDSRSAEGRAERRTEPAFQLIQTAYPELYAQFNSEPEVERFMSAASDFFDTQGIPLGFIYMGGIYHAKLLIIEYFNRLGEFNIDHQMLKEVCTEYVENARSPSAKLINSSLVEHFNAPSEFELCEGIRFRRVTPEDINRFGRARDRFWSSLEQPIMRSDGWICEIQITVAKNHMDMFGESSRSLEDVAGALNFSSEGRCTFTPLASYFESPFASTMTSLSGNEVISGIRSPVSITKDEIESFKAIYRKLQELKTDPGLEYLRLPFRRLRLAASRTNNEDRLVDYVIGMERLLTNREERQEIGFRFRLRGAALLPKDYGDVPDRVRLMRRLYELRSRVVHGDFTTNEINEILPQAEKVLKTIFLWHLNHANELGGRKNVISKLDESLVSGGAEWAYSTEAARYE